MQIGAAAGVVGEIVLVGVEAAAVGSAVLILTAGIWGFKALRRAL